MKQPTIKTKTVTVYICQICGRETSIRVFCPDCGKYICERCLGNTYFPNSSDYPRDGDEAFCKVCWHKAGIDQEEKELKIHNDFKANTSLSFRIECLENILGIKYRRDGIEYFSGGGYLNQKYPPQKEMVK